MKKAFFIGRFTPPHKGHIKAIENLIENFDEVVIGIGSCYEVGTERHPFLALFREKMLLNSLKNNLHKIKIVHIKDFDTFEEWINSILEISKQLNITHFVSGNEKDILSVLKEKNIELPFEFINPELKSDIPYHATDLREAIKEGNYEKFIEIAADGTVELMANINGFNGLREALENNGESFFSGEQTVDLVFTINEKHKYLNNKTYYKKYLLCGLRSDKKENFPNQLGLIGTKIKNFESPLDAVIRAVNEKTNIKLTLLNNTLEPAHVMLEYNDLKIITELKFLGLFNTNDIRYTGNNGGSSQCFTINIDTNHELFKNIKHSEDFKNLEFILINEAIDLNLAYEQTKMVMMANKK